MQRKVTVASLAMAALLVSAGAALADPPNFDFNGYAQIPAGLGGALTLRSVLTNNGVVPTPIPLNFALNQYTLVVTGTMNASAGINQDYNLTSLSVYEDPIGGGTAADYANGATFTDGTLILSGAFSPNLRRITFTPTLGSFIGTVNFTGGTQLGALGTLANWPFGGGWSRTIGGIPAGYQENWDGKIDLGTVGVDSRTWDGVKRLYR